MNSLSRKIKKKKKKKKRKVIQNFALQRKS